MSDRELIEKLREEAKGCRDVITNSEAVVTAFADELARFDKREGHNVYAVRIAVDHKSAIRTETKRAEMLEAAADRLEVLSQGVKVKPLEWIESGGLATTDWYAKSVCGTYVVEAYWGSDSFGWNADLDGAPIKGSWDDPDNAKSAAQADYESRILAALENPNG